MDGAGPSSQGGSIWYTGSRSTPVFRRVLVRVGHTSPRMCRVRGVVGAGEVVTHQSSRNEGNVFGIAVISGGGHQSSCDRNVRQLYSCGLRQQAGQDGVPLPLLVGQSSSEVGRESRHPPRCEVFTRAVQCSGRSPQPLGSGHKDRVVSPPAGGNRSASCLGLPVAGLVHDAPEREASAMLFPRPGSPCSLRGCVSPSLGQPGRVRVSALSTGRAGSGQSQRDPQSLHDPGHSSLAREGVVRRPSPTDPTTSRATLVELAVGAAPLQPLPPRCPRAEPHTWRLSSVSSESRTFRNDLVLRCPAASNILFPSVPGAVDALL